MDFWLAGSLTGYSGSALADFANWESPSISKRNNC